MDHVTQLEVMNQGAPPPAVVRDVTREQIRGSSLLLAGRMLAITTNLVAQVLIVRYLSTADYGAWAYALSVVALLQGFAPFGLDRATSRFVPIYQERKEYDKALGTILLVVGTILAVSLVTIAAFFLIPDQLARLVKGENQSLALLFIAIFLVPVEALDALLIDLFACFGHPRAIFFRRYVLAPGLKLAVVLLLILFQSGVRLLAYGYLVASALGVLVYGWVLLRAWRRQGLLEQWRQSGIRVPAREVFSFSIPLLTSDLVNVVMHSSAALLLGYFHGMTEVAFFRVVLPLAVHNRLVMNSFSTLYKPAAARLFARENQAELNRLYWQSAAWIAVLSFPIFAATFSLARPLTTSLYGARYESSSVILAVLALGYYFDAALGNNGLTLKVMGKVRYVLTINVLICLITVGIHLLLIPRFGALGAGVGTAAALVAYNVLKQAGLRLATGISLFERNYVSFYLTIAIGAGVLLIVSFFSPTSLLAIAVMVGLVSLLVAVLCRKNLRIQETFPEITRLPVMRLLFTGSPASERTSACST